MNHRQYCRDHSRASERLAGALLQRDGRDGRNGRDGEGRPCDGRSAGRAAAQQAGLTIVSAHLVNAACSKRSPLHGPSEGLRRLIVEGDFA